jgi:phosphotransferase system enzyme I (PtsI)
MNSDPPGSRVFPPVLLHGLSGSPGIGVGPCIVINRRASAFNRRAIRDADIDKEVERFRLSVREGEAKLREVISQAATSVLGELAILEAYVLMLGDPILTQEVERKIRWDRKCSEWAIGLTVREFAERLGGVQDPYLRERAQDFHFVGDLLLRVLQGEFHAHPLASLDSPIVIVAHDLSPADMASLVGKSILGIVTECGTRTGHTSIIARALEIPAVVGVVDALHFANPSDEVVVDGFSGNVVVRPTSEQRGRASRRAGEYQLRKDQMRENVRQPVVMACGAPVLIRANIQLPEEALLIAQRGARGIGLYRTEFLFINQTSLPTEDDQYRIYRALIETVAPEGVTLRTFDIGGDKFASALSFPSEMNPALGLRAIRLALCHPEILRQQLRAMIRASAHGPVKIMLPMVSTLTEVRDIKTLFHSLIEDMDRQHMARSPTIPLGVMLEVPSALILADRFAEEADFMSIGTNDLLQYTLAADRTNRSLAYLSNPFDPAILRLILAAVKAAERKEKPLSVCGEMASDPLGAILLVGLGLRELSMEVVAIPEIKEALRRVSLEEARDIAHESMNLDTAEHVEQFVARAFAPRLADLLQSDSED